MNIGSCSPEGRTSDTEFWRNVNICDISTGNVSRGSGGGTSFHSTTTPVVKRWQVKENFCTSLFFTDRFVCLYLCLLYPRLFDSLSVSLSVSQSVSQLVCQPVSQSLSVKFVPNVLHKQYFQSTFIQNYHNTRHCLFHPLVNCSLSWIRQIFTGFPSGLRTQP